MREKFISAVRCCREGCKAIPALRKIGPTRFNWADKVYFKADSLDAVANRIGVDAVGLVETVRKMNSYAASGVDSDFGKGTNSFDRS